MIKYFFAILLISLPLFSQDKASTVHFDIIYPAGMEKCAYYIISYLEKNYKIQSEKLKFEINDPIMINLSYGNSSNKKKYSRNSIDVKFSGSYIEAGEAAAFQLSCVLISAMKNDSLLINKSIVNDIPEWIIKGYSLYITSTDIGIDAAGLTAADKKKYSEILKSPEIETFNHAAVSFFGFLEKKFKSRIPLFFREAYDSGGVTAAFEKIYGKSEDELVKIWKDTLQIDEIISEAEDESQNRNFIFSKDSAVAVSPDGTAAIIGDKDGIMIKTFSDGTERKISSGIFYNQSQIMAWHPDSGAVCRAEIKADQILVSSIDLKTDGVFQVFYLPFRRISDMKIYAGGKYLFIGYTNESSGIFFFNSLTGKLNRIVSDYSDKKFPVLADENTVLYFSNKNSNDNPFSAKYSLYVLDLKLKQDYKIIENIKHPSGISALSKDKVAVSFKMNGISSVYSLDFKSAVLKNAIKNGFDPSWISDGMGICYFKNYLSGKKLFKKTFSAYTADSSQDLLKNEAVISDSEKITSPNEVIFRAD